MMKKSIINGLRELPLKYKITVVISVFIMTSYGLSVFIWGAPPIAKLTPSEITISPGETVNFDASQSERVKV